MKMKVKHFLLEHKLCFKAHLKSFPHFIALEDIKPVTKYFI